MGKLIYSMSVSADGYIAGPDGKFDWAMPDEELHRFHNEQTRALAGHLLGRRLYETMVYWETIPSSAKNALAASKSSTRMHVVHPLNHVVLLASWAVSVDPTD